jgi:uncharacterized membrane protein
MKSEPAEHFVHRLEAFSDIVIGFSLAQLGASLVIPEHAETLIEHPGWFFGFLLAFSVVCSMWFFHHRLFSRYFVASPLTVVLNFVWLAVVVLLVYATEVYVRTPENLVAVRMYFGAYTAAYAILGVQYLIAIRRGADAGARRVAVFTLLWTLPFALCLVFTSALPPSTLLGVLTISVFSLTGVASVFLSRYYRRTGSVERGA